MLSSHTLAPLALDWTGEEFETEVAALNRQLGHVRARQERVSQQRDHWRDRCLLYERACSQLQVGLAWTMHLFVHAF